MHAACRALGGMLTSALRRRRPIPSHSGRDEGPSVVVRYLFRIASLVEYPKFCVSQARVFVVLGVCPDTMCTFKVCVVFLDTLTPVFELELGPESLKVPGMGLQLCGLQVPVPFVGSFVLWYVVYQSRQVLRLVPPAVELVALCELVLSQGDVLEKEWPSRRLVRKLEMLRHLSRRSLCHRTHTVVLFLRRHFHLSQPDPDIARAWLDAVERTFRSMECVPEERVLLASYQLQAQALTWWSSEWETTFQSRPLRQILWQEFVVSFERAFCPTYVRTERLYQFLDLQQRDFTVVQYRARFVELGHYAPQIMADEGLRTQQFVRGLRPELRQALIVARVTDLDAAYQTAAALEADTLRTRARSAEVQTQVVPTQPRQQQGSVQTTLRTVTSYASTSTGTTAKSGSRRKFRRDRRQAEQRQQSVGSVQQPVEQPSQQIVLCYLVCRSSRPSHSLECSSSSSSSSRHLCSSVSRPEVLVGGESGAHDQCAVIEPWSLFPCVVWSLVGRQVGPIAPIGSGYECDRGVCCVLNAAALVVVFYLPTEMRSSELGLESLKVPGMGLQLCGLHMWCWLFSTVLWLYCVVVERQLDPSSVTARLRGGSCVVLSGLVEVLPVVVCPGGGMILVVVSLWYLVVAGVEVGLGSVVVDGVTFHLMPVLLPFKGRLPVKLVASATSCRNDLPMRHVA
ncbi:hypothetical protein Taro_047197 [Colocasia esculenta]|uniref:Retrotransposon gag domain-containing protein n=1 Tax=Colocasia esculenta TaxID=4460 RepID=A0A843X3I2_COLES|nr:hypothetical protein [Colocasia esculenta]